MQLRFVIFTALGVMGLSFTLLAVLLLSPVQPLERLQTEPSWFQSTQASLWKKLGDWHYSKQHYHKASQAYRNSFINIWQQPLPLGQFAESLILSQNGDVSEEANNLLKLVLAQNPEHQQALWMSAVAAKQANQADKAIHFLSRLQTLLPPMSDEAKHIRQSLRKLENNDQAALLSAFEQFK